MINKIYSSIRRRLSQLYERRGLIRQFNDGDNIYNFSAVDFNLYFSEKKTILSKIKRSSGVDGGVVKIDILDHTIYWPSNVDSKDLPWLYHEIFDGYNNNPSSYNHPKMNYKDAKYIIDAGCCEGFFSKFVFDINNNCKIVAMEPLLEMQDSLKKTFLNNKNFYIDQRALGKEEGVMKFDFNPAHLCDSRLSRDRGYDVGVTTLDEICRKYKLIGDGVIKMDIEGAEMEALHGATNFLKSNKPKLAIAVYHEYENAMKCRDIILKANPEYNIEFRGMYGYFYPQLSRPYILFAW